MFENVDGRTTDAGVTILIAHLGAFGSGELIMNNQISLPPFILLMNNWSYFNK